MKPFRYTLLAASILMSGLVLFAQNYSKIPKYILEEQFLTACETGDLATMQRLLDKGVSPNVKDKFGQPAILRAVRGSGSQNAIEVLKLLLSKGVDVNSTNSFGTTALFLTQSNNQIVSDAHKYLLENGADPDRKDKYGLTPAQRPAFYDHAKIDKEEVTWRLLIEGDLIRSVEPVETRFVNSATFNMAAAYYGHLFNKQIGQHEDSSVDENGDTYLFYMAHRRTFSIDEFLDDIDGKISNTRNKKGETALIRSAKFDCDYLTAKLLRAGADPDIRDMAGKTALYYAANYDYFLTTLALLIKADPNLTFEDGKTALILAVEANNIRSVAAFVNAKKTALKAAQDARDVHTDENYREMLVQMEKTYDRTDLDIQDARGRTALMIAAEKGYKEIVETLREIGAKMTLKDKKGRTALDLAKTNGHAAIVALLDKK